MSPLRVATGGNANWSSRVRCRRSPPARIDGARTPQGLKVESSPLGGAPNEHENCGKTLTPVGHPFMTPSERRFAPTTVRQDRNGVRYGLEQVSAFIGIRSSRRAMASFSPSPLRRAASAPSFHFRRFISSATIRCALLRRFLLSMCQPPFLADTCSSNCFFERLPKTTPGGSP